MQFNKPLIPAILKGRYKRFLADVLLEDGKEITVHCPNPGAMLGLKEAGFKCWISKSDNEKRKLSHTLELMEVPSDEGAVLVGINTNLPNKLAHEAIVEGKIEALCGYDQIKREVPYGLSSRIDLLLEKEGRRPCYVEVKNVHLMRQKGLHEFPDCKTVRGTKHLGELVKMVEQGARAVMLYVIQRGDGSALRLAHDLDPDYNKAFLKARKLGVEAYAIACKISLEEINAEELVPIVE